MTTTVRIPSVTVEGATVGEALDNFEAAYPGLKGCLRDEQGSIAPYVSVFVDGEDVRRLDGLNTPVDGADLYIVPDLATYGYQHGEPCDPGPDWSAWNAAQIAPHRTARPEAAVAGVVTAHARLLEVVEGLDDASLRRRGPTRFGFETSGWDLLVAEAAHEREHAARLAAHACRPARARDPPCHQPGPAPHTS